MENKEVKNINLTKRESNMELLRIIAMLLIVFHHFAVHGNFHFDETNLNINYLWYAFISLGGKLGVNIFILISGYFLVKDKEIKFDLKHIFKFIFQVLFYSVFIVLIYTIITKEPVNYQTLKATFLPIIFEKWWFVSNYFILYLLHPFINKVLVNLNKKEYKILLIILIICFSLIPTFLHNGISKSYLIWFITLYCIAGYIKLHGINEKIKTHHYLITFIILSLLVYLSTIGILPFKSFMNIYSPSKINTLILAISLFMFFKNIKINNSYLINLIASATFGVYLIHDEPLMRNFLWNNLFKNATYQDSSILIPYSILVCLIVYIACTIIELLRKKLIENPIINVFNTKPKVK